MMITAAYRKWILPTGFAVLLAILFVVRVVAAEQISFSEWKLNEGTGQILENSADFQASGWLGDSPEEDAADPQWQDEGGHKSLLFSEGKRALIPDGAWADFSQSQGFTIQVWFKPMVDVSKQISRMQLLTKGADSAAKNWQLMLLYNQQKHQGYLNFAFKHHTKNFEISAPLPQELADTWSRTTITGDGEKLKLYLNGKLLSERDCEELPPQNPYPLIVGAYAFGRKLAMVGNIRNLSIRKQAIIPDAMIEPSAQKILLNSDFSKAGSEKNWHPVNGKWFLDNSAYCEHSDLNSEKGIWSVSGEQTWQNYSLETTIRCLDSLGSVLLATGWQTIDNHYQIIHRSYSSGMTQLAIVKIKDGQKSILASIDNSENPLPTPAQNQDIDYKIYCFEGIITVMINGHFLLSIIDNDFPSGKVAIGEHERKICIKSVKVKELTQFISPLTPVQRKPIEISIRQDALRQAFFRGESIPFSIVLQNNTRKPLAPQTVCVKIDRGIGECARICFPELMPGNENSRMISLPTDAWKSGEYKMTAWIEETPCENSYDLFLAPEKRNDTFRFHSWGGSSDVPFFKSLQEHGFNGLSIAINPAEDFAMQKAYLARIMNQAVRYGQDITISYTCLWATLPGADTRVMRHDGSKGNAPDPWNPKQRDWALERMEKLAHLLKNYPSVNGFLLNSENENIAEPDYSPAGQNRAERELGFKMPLPENLGEDKDNTDGRLIRVPQEVKAQTPAVFPDNNEWYCFFKWFWQRGYGDNILNEELKNIIKKHIPNAVVTHDPFRDVPLFYRNKGLDQVGTWFYAHPDASESLGMVETLVTAARDESTSKGINIGASLWLYGEQICPAKDRYAGVQPTDVITQSDWVTFSRIPAAIEHFSISHLMPSQKPEYKQDNTYEKLAQFSKEVLQPFWPFVSRLERAPRRCAMLISFSSQLFGNTIWGGYGYTSGYGCYAALQMAHIPTDILFDENIQRGELNKYDVLYLHQISHLPESIFTRIVEFAKNGGTVVCGKPFAERIPGAIAFEMDMSRRCKASWYNIRRGEGFTADIVYQDMLKNADAIRKLLGNKVQRFVDSDSPEVFLNVLEKNGARYIFVVNDKRTFGDYVGEKYRAIMEKGLPQTVMLALNTENQAVYDLMSQRKIDAVSKGPQQIVTVDLKPAWGTILAIYPQEIKFIDLILPQELEAGKKAQIVITVASQDGTPIPGVQPLAVTILEPDGKKNEYSGYFAANNGRCQVPFVPAINDLPEKWSVSVTELSSGKTIAKEMQFSPKK